MAMSHSLGVETGIKGGVHNEKMEWIKDGNRQTSNVTMFYFGLLGQAKADIRKR